VKSGDAYAAVKIVEGGSTWSRPWKRSANFSISDKAFVTPNSKDTPIITVANDAADYGHNFAAFKQALIAQPILWKEGTLTFATITHEGPLKPGRISGQAVDVRRSRVNDSPFIRSERDSGVFLIRKSDQTLKLDFSAPENPVRTIGVPVTSEFPPGVGATLPIVFPS
jgi:hypothetical protein